MRISALSLFLLLIANIASAEIVKVKHRTIGDFMSAWGSAGAADHDNDVVSSFVYNVRISDKASVIQKRNCFNDESHFATWGELPKCDNVSQPVIAFGNVWLFAKKENHWRLHKAKLDQTKPVWTNESYKIDSEITGFSLDENSNPFIITQNNEDRFYLTQGIFTGGGYSIQWNEPEWITASHKERLLNGIKNGGGLTPLYGEFDLDDEQTILSFGWNSYAAEIQSVRFRLSKTSNERYGPWSQPLGGDSVRIGANARFLHYELRPKAGEHLLQSPLPVLTVSYLSKDDHESPIANTKGGSVGSSSGSGSNKTNSKPIPMNSNTQPVPADEDTVSSSEDSISSDKKPSNQNDNNISNQPTNRKENENLREENSSNQNPEDDTTTKQNASNTDPDKNPQSSLDNDDKSSQPNQQAEKESNQSKNNPNDSNDDEQDQTADEQDEKASEPEPQSKPANSKQAGSEDDKKDKLKDDKSGNPVNNNLKTPRLKPHQQNIDSAKSNSSSNTPTSPNNKNEQKENTNEHKDEENDKDQPHVKKNTDEDEQNPSEKTPRSLEEPNEGNATPIPSKEPKTQNKPGASGSNKTPPASKALKFNSPASSGSGAFYPAHLPEKKPMGQEPKPDFDFAPKGGKAGSALGRSVSRMIVDVTPEFSHASILASSIGNLGYQSEGRFDSPWWWLLFLLMGFILYLAKKRLAKSTNSTTTDFQTIEKNPLDRICSKVTPQQARWQWMMQCQSGIVAATVSDGQFAFVTKEGEIYLGPVDAFMKEHSEKSMRSNAAKIQKFKADRFFYEPQIELFQNHLFVLDEWTDGKSRLYRYELNNAGKIVKGKRLPGFLKWMDEAKSLHRAQDRVWLIGNREGKQILVSAKLKKRKLRWRSHSSFNFNSHRHLCISKGNELLFAALPHNDPNHIWLYAPKTKSDGVKPIAKAPFQGERGIVTANSKCTFIAECDHRKHGFNFHVLTRDNEGNFISHSSNKINLPDGAELKQMAQEKGALYLVVSKPLPHDDRIGIYMGNPSELLKSHCQAA